MAAGPTPPLGLETFKLYETMTTKRRKSDSLELPDEEFPNPQWTEFAQIPKLPGLEIRLNPRLDEIVAETRRRGLKDKAGKSDGENER